LEKSELIEILSNLSPKEFRGLGDFVCSPYFNKNEGVIKLYNYFKKYYPDFPEKCLKKDNIFKELFPKMKYNDSHLRSLIFKLNSLAETLLAINEYRKDPYSEQFQLVNSLLDKSLDRRAGKIMAQREKKLKEIKNQNADYFYALYKLENMKDIIYSRMYRPLTIKDKPDEKLKAESDNFIKYFLITILARYRYLLNKGSTVKTILDLDFLNEILSFLGSEGKKFLNVRLVWILYKQIMLLLHPNSEKIFIELKPILTDDSIPMDKEERKNGLAIIINYCINKYYSGFEKHRIYLNELYKYLIERNLYNRIKGGYFETAMFNNIITIALFTEDKEWAINFLEKYHSKLAPDSRANSYNMNYAKIYFKRKEFKTSLEYISKVDYEDIYYKIHVRTLAIALHYEMNNFETAINIIESFRKFVGNDKLLTDQHRVICSNFIKFVTILLKVKSNNSEENLEQLKINISASSDLPYRLWLVEKTDELISKFKKK